LARFVKVEDDLYCRDFHQSRIHGDISIAAVNLEPKRESDGNRRATLSALQVDRIDMRHRLRGQSLYELLLEADAVRCKILSPFAVIGNTDIATHASSAK
jgi:hypothetical protein